MHADVCLECLIEAEGSWADRALKWVIRGCGIVIRHRLGSETMDNGRIEFVGIGEVEIEPSMSA